jgi:hypothetical protein
MSILVSLLVQNRIFLEIFRSKSYAARRRTKQKQIYNKELKYKKIQKKKGQSTFLFLSHISNIQSTNFEKQQQIIYCQHKFHFMQSDSFCFQLFVFSN